SPLRLGAQSYRERRERLMLATPEHRHGAYPPTCPAGSRTTAPPFITKSMCRRQVTSESGSPGVATMSASMPGSTEPSSLPLDRVAALTAVNELSASLGDSPALTSSS